MRMKKVISVVGSLAISMAAGLLTGCGAGGGNDDNVFTYWLYEGVDSQYYTDYSDNPALQYTLAKTYGPEDKSLSFDFWIPPAGTAVDNYSTMLGSGDYADVIQNTIGDTPLNSYENGISLDLTEYVEKYMPNYQAYIEEHPEIKADAVTDVDGEERYLAIVSFNEDYPAMNWGYEYRRDWIVKYGTNPVTGEAFTGGYTDLNDPDSWEDDVVFPSGESDPIYISDWEWMFDIFEKAYADLGIDDTYCISIQYTGYCGVGDLNAAFGGGSSGYWYRNLDNEIVFGPVTEEFRSYLQCMSTWYEKGWLDPHFNERTSDMFYEIDNTNVRQGKVGMWYGVTGQLGSRMDTGDELTSGICVYGASIPINDIYGDESTQNQKPYCGFGGTLKETSYLITTAAKDKDLATLCSYFDSFYTEEGAAIRTLGLTKEQAETIDSTFYTDNGLENGAYVVEGDEYVVNPAITNDSGNLLGASVLKTVPGITLVDQVDRGYADTFQNSIDQWGKYANLGFFQGSSMTSTMTDEETKTYENISSKIGDYMAANVPGYITGAKKPDNDNDWNQWIQMMETYDYQDLSDIAQKYADIYPLVIKEE